MSDTSPPRLLDRRAEERDEPDLTARLLADPATVVLDVVGDRVPVAHDDNGARVVDRAPAPGDEDGLVVFLGRDDRHRAHVAVVRPAGDAVAGPPGATFASPRDVGGALPELDLDRTLTSVGLANWHASHNRCARCGAPSRASRGGWIRVCEADGSEHFPRTDPAVIMAVVDEDDRILLARNPAWPPGRRSVLAGFVEPGECLEDAVAREVAEEVGVTVTDVRYVASQPWPFPASLMLGFTARARTIDLVAQPDEIAEVEWYSRADLERAVADGSLGLPGRLSIARRLLEDWFGGPLTPPAEVNFHRDDPQAPRPESVPSEAPKLP